MNANNNTVNLPNDFVFQFNYPSAWSPTIVSTQLVAIGPLMIACVPGEFTTMSGRRLRRAIKKVLCNDGAKCVVVIAGLCNSYSDYITTPEEYKVIRKRWTVRMCVSSAPIEYESISVGYTASIQSFNSKHNC